jgi:carbon storage regulator
MLVLSRKPGEELVIGNNIRLTVLTIRGKQVRLGITVPVEMPVRAQELCRSENQRHWPHSPAPDEAAQYSHEAGPAGIGP